MVHPDDRAIMEECLQTACEHSGVRVVSQFKTPHATQRMLHGRTSDGQHHLLSLDIHTAESCFGVAYWDAAECVARSRSMPVERFEWKQSGKLSTAPCLPPAWSDLIRFQDRFLCQAELAPDEVQFLLEADPKTTQAIEQTVRKWYGASLSESILQALREGDPKRLQPLAKRARRRLMLRRLRFAPWRTITEFTRTAYALRVRPFLRPRGLCVAFMGTDGSGKTTLIENFRRTLDAHYRGGENSVRKLRPGWLPQINRLAHWRALSYTAEDCSRPHRAAPSGALGSLLRASWYGLDCVIGWPLRILPKRRRNSLLIFDRYYHDFLVDPKRARIAQSSHGPRLWSRWIPRPDAMFVCVADPERIHARKQELPFVEIKRQVNAYKQLVRDHPHMHLIHTDGSIDDSLDQALSAMYAVPIR